MSGRGRLHLAATRRHVQAAEEPCHRARQPGQPWNPQQSVPTQLLLRWVLPDVVQVNCGTLEAGRVQVAPASGPGTDTLDCLCISYLMIGLDSGLHGNMTRKEEL